MRVTLIDYKQAKEENKTMRYILGLFAVLVYASMAYAAPLYGAEIADMQIQTQGDPNCVHMDVN